MALPQNDPSLPGGPAPLFSDIDAARGDHMRANNQAIWLNLEYLNISKNINDAAAATPVDADKLGFWQVAGLTIKHFLWSDLKSLVIAAAQTAFANLFVPVGTYIQHAGSTAPAGYLACNGAAVSRTTYANLFAVIGTVYGAGDGSTTFNLPDARGLVMVGAGAHGSMTRANGTAFNGGSVGASRNDQMQGHNHIQAFGVSTSPGERFGRITGLSVITQYPDWDTGAGSANYTEAPLTSAQNSDGTNGTPRTGDETRPAEIAVLVCIKF